MKKTTAVTKEKSLAVETAGSEIGKVAFYAVGTTSVLIGCWAVVCLFSGMISSGGPVGLVSNYFSALLG